MKKLFSMLLCGAMLVSFNACEQNDDVNDGNVANSHEYVDLGLPSGILWATCNVGATSPEDYGDFYAWGETQPKEKYDWLVEGDYKWGIDDSASPNYGMVKYNSTDGKTILDSSDDAATANWGGEWRMPTREECQELLTNCTWQWTTLKGVNGYKVSSNVEGNSNYIFLPAAGRSHATELIGVGSDGNYWSSSLEEQSPDCAGDLCFYPDEYYWNGHSRCLGQSVRPVCSLKK